MIRMHDASVKAKANPKRESILHPVDRAAMASIILGCRLKSHLPYLSQNTLLFFLPTRKNSVANIAINLHCEGTLSSPFRIKPVRDQNAEESDDGRIRRFLLAGGYLWIPGIGYQAFSLLAGICGSFYW